MLGDNIYKNKIRPISISIIRNKKKILVYKREDDISGENFHRLVGGCIEFGEESDKALKREFTEELNLEIHDIKLLSTFESIFMFNGKKLHEIVFLFESKFKKKEIYKNKEISGLEGERGFNATWMDIQDFLDNKYVLYPEEVKKYL